MIICDDKKWILVRNPKTGSRSLTNFLLETLPCREHDTYHSLAVPRPDYKIYIVIRNPLSRAVSAWNHVKLTNEMSLHDYLMRKKFWPLTESNNYFSQCEIMDKLDGQVEIIRYEELKQRVSEIFGQGQMSKIGQSRSDWVSSYTPSTLKLALEVFEPEFERFGYERRLPKRFI